MKQEDLARRARISVRTLRDVERSNHPIAATMITAIAAALDVTTEEIISRKPDDVSSGAATLPPVYHLKLEAVEAYDLSAMAERSNRYEHTLLVTPNAETAKTMQEVMIVVRRWVLGFSDDTADEFDQSLFSDFPRLAYLQELLEKLRAGGVGVIAGMYPFVSLASETEPASYIGRDGQRRKVLTTLRISFVPGDVKEEVVWFHPGTLDEDKVKSGECPFGSSPFGSS